ncbi:MAG: STAS domain-containing protein [Pseudomonadota bacterium]
MNIDHTRRGATDVLSITGRIDTTTAPQLEKALMSTINAGQGSVVLDLANVEYVSSAGLRVFLLGVKAMAGAARRFTLAAVSRDVLDVINLTGFQRVLTLAETVDAACEQG